MLSSSDYQRKKKASLRMELSIVHALQVQSVICPIDSTSSKISFVEKVLTNSNDKLLTALHGSNSISPGGECQMRSGLYIIDSGPITWLDNLIIAKKF